MSQQIDLFEHIDVTGVVELAVTERVSFTDRDRTLHEWVLTAGRFRAVIPECPCGLVATLGTVHQRDNPNVVERTITTAKTNCLCRSDACRRSSKNNLCHGWHRPRVERYAADLRRTIEGKKR